MTSPRIGMIGIGMMGHGIASNLARKGQQLMVLEHPGNQPIDDLLALGVQSTARIAQLAEASEIVIICVNGSAQVEAIMGGDDGLLAAIRPGTTIIDCSTSIPASTVKVAAQVEHKGGSFLDAAMTRTPNEAAQGRLNLLVGGDVQLLERCRPILACFAENIVHAGAVGAGHRMKLLHNFVSLGSVALIAEAAACARESGIADEVLVDVLAKGGGWGAALDRLKPYLVNNDTSGLRFSLANALKDIGYYNQMASDAGMPHQIAQSVLQTVSIACEQGDPQALMPELVARISAQKSR